MATFMDRRTASRLPLEHERALVDRVASQRDAAAFNELYDFYLPRIYGFVYRRLGDHDVAEDLTASTFERGLQALRRGSFRNEVFGGWLYRVAANAVVDHVRRGSRTLALDGDAAGRPVWIDRADEPWATTHDRDQLERAMRALPPAHQRVIRLRFYDDLDPSEASAVLGCSPRTFAVKLHRALAALRGQLASEVTDVA